MWNLRVSWKSAFDCCDMSHTLFVVGAITPQDLVFVRFSPSEEGGFVEVLLISRAFPLVFALSGCSLVM